jgi:DNA-binding LytR/AlgR family response regulator
VPDRIRLAAEDRPASPDDGAAVETTAAGRGVDLGQGTFGPLGGAGGPPRRVAQQLPVERDGGTHFVPVDDVVAVHANAHYTYIFDGKTKLFCSLPIGVVESRLDSSRFVRVHRSHIVAIDRIVGLKRAGETGLLELAALEPYSVPVSRGRMAWLKSRLAITTGDSGPDVAEVAPSLAVQHR